MQPRQAADTRQTQSSDTVSILTFVIGIITLVLVLLKLTGLINWDWLWIIVLLWGPSGLYIAGFLLIFLYHSLTRK